VSIPKTGNVSLRAARQDCGLSANGPQKVIELSDRAGTTNWTSSGFSVPTVKLSELRGRVISRPTDHVATTGTDTPNTSPGAACRVNRAELSVFTQNTRSGTRCQVGLNPANHYANGLYCECKGWSNYPYDWFAGFVFAGTIEENGEYDHTIYIGPKLASGRHYCTIETIGWSDGFFQGTPKYLFEFRGWLDRMRDESYFGSSKFTADLGHPFITINVHAWARGSQDDYFKIHIERMGIVKL